VPWADRPPDRSDSLDLDHEIWTGKAGDANRRAGRGRYPQVTHTHVAAFLELVKIGDESIGRDHIGPCRAGRPETSVEVLECLFHLGAHVALSDTVPIDIPRQLAGDVNDLAGAAHCHDVRVGRLPGGQPDIHALRLKPFDL
jgi:hypothetical protein